MEETGGRFGFDKSQRLLTPADYKQVFDQASIKVSNAEILILAIPNNLGKPRLGLVIAKKHAKRAVARNRIKRQARESFRLLHASLGGIDIVLLGRKGIGSLDQIALRQALDHLWDQLGRKARRKIPAPDAQHE
jgi:ribonuclease P protein component